MNIREFKTVGLIPLFAVGLKNLTLQTLNEKRECVFQKRGQGDKSPCGVEGQSPSWGVRRNPTVL